MTATYAIESQGVTFAVGDGESPETFNNVREVMSIAGPGGSASVIDVSTLDSTAREKIMGLKDEGQITLEVNYDPTDTNGQKVLQTARTNRTQKNFRITFTNTGAEVASFAGYVTGFTISSGVDEVVKASITIEITGPVTFA